MKTLFYLVALMLIASNASADWRIAKIEMIAVGYDGQTISVGHKGANKENCTCYPTWPNRYCLDLERQTFEQEYALLLAALAKGSYVAINIDENTCKIKAMYEKSTE